VQQYIVPSTLMACGILVSVKHREPFIEMGEEQAPEKQYNFLRSCTWDVHAVWMLTYALQYEATTSPQ
jgi:hypothetical protein